MKRVGRLLLPLAVVVAGCWAIVGWTLSPVSDQETEVLFIVEPGAGLGSVARDLSRDGLVRNARALEWLGRLRGVASELRSGDYDLSPSLSSGEILDRLVEGRVRTVEVVIPEGLSAIEIAERLASVDLAEADSILARVNDPEAPARLGVEGDSLEGYLYPETYQLARGLPAEQIVETLVRQFLEVWKELEPLAARRKLSMKEVVTLASIVEKETGAKQERPLIASVFLNRLERRMRLESDPTTIYGIPDFDGNLRRRHLEDPANPYNTYRIAALPPGPIANPGEGALRAVLEPASSDFLYFVSRNDGTHHFSRTYGEHLRAVDRYQRRRR